MNGYVKGTARDKADIVDFINYVFSQAHVPHDFKTLIPKVYGDRADGLNAEHYLIRQDGKIKALVADRFVSLSVAGTVLRVGLIGSVSVHPYSRGKGYMKELMKQAVDDAVRTDTDLMVLGGQRQRYEYFGFENAGTQLHFRVTGINMRHCFSGLDCSRISFRAPEGDDFGFIASLYEKRPLHTVRGIEEYPDLMCNWNCDCKIICRDGERIGYSYAGCGELLLTDEADFAVVLKALFEQNGWNDTEITVSPFDTERAAFLSSVCESVSVQQVEMVNVLHWKPVLQSFLTLKAGYTPLEDGTADFAVDGQGFRITVTDGVPQVTEAGLTPDVPVMTHNEAEQLFFGIKTLLLPEKKFRNWLPLPFVIDMPDTF